MLSLRALTQPFRRRASPSRSCCYCRIEISPVDVCTVDTALSLPATVSVRLNCLHSSASTFDAPSSIAATPLRHPKGPIIGKIWPSDLENFFSS
ncbi:hypothetical protein VDGE_30524 [Verticillium dahliae]|uniref:Uncharacterized protein n=1 Tax=Verticillium dahliae TaxID=27337 RepID=A0A444RUK0_VERDA|nr:hypothetical protein VDGE_30524 [Verticillium dahliae]